MAKAKPWIIVNFGIPRSIPWKTGHIKLSRFQRLEVDDRDLAKHLLMFQHVDRVDEDGKPIKRLHLTKRPTHRPVTTKAG